MLSFLARLCGRKQKEEPSEFSTCWYYKKVKLMTKQQPKISVYIDAKKRLKKPIEFREEQIFTFGY